LLDRRLIINFDWATLITAVFISAIGVVNIYSSTYPHSGAGTPLFLKQVYWLFMGFGFLAFTLSFDYRTFIRYSYSFYLFSLFLLVMVMIFGRTTSGSQRWIQLGFISFQPSELSKIALILALTRFFTEKENPSSFSGSPTWEPCFCWS
jgi:rod shape determining protein RodA